MLRNKQTGLKQYPRMVPNIEDSQGIPEAGETDPPQVFSSGHRWATGRFYQHFMQRIYEHIQYARMHMNGDRDGRLVSSMMIVFTVEPKEGGPDGPERIACAFFERYFPAMLVVPVPVRDQIQYGQPSSASGKDPCFVSKSDLDDAKRAKVINGRCKALHYAFHLFARWPRLPGSIKFSSSDTAGELTRRLCWFSA